MLCYFAKCAKRVSVTEPKESDIPDKRQRNGIGGEASVNVAIGGETSVTVAVIDSQETKPQFGATLPPQRVGLGPTLATVDLLTSL